MRFLIVGILTFFSILTYATEQIPDKLVYKSDTIFINFYPLEKLMNVDSIIRKKIFQYSDTVCISSGCWRGHIGTWKIENDSLFLISLEQSCESRKFSLEYVFGKEKVKNGKVFAKWYSNDIDAVFGKWLRFYEDNWKNIYSKSFKCQIRLGIVTSLYIINKTDCEIASVIAEKDFNDSKYSLHSQEFLPTENTYLFVLKKKYNIDWFFTDSTEYYSCYDSVMIAKLGDKLGKQFLKQAKFISDSLENTDNWIKDAEFPGGKEEMLKFISNNLKLSSSKPGEIKTKLIIEIEIDSTGKAINPIIRKGINTEIDEKVIMIIQKMPTWHPAYRFGKPTRQKYYIPLNLDFK